MEKFPNISLAAREVNQHGTNTTSNNNVGGWQYIDKLIFMTPAATESQASLTDPNLEPLVDFRTRLPRDGSSDLPEISSEETDPDNSSCERAYFPHDEETTVDKPFLPAIATTYCAKGSLRLYFQERLAIYEVTCYEDGTWTNPKQIRDLNVRPNTQLAVVSHSGGTKIHLFYITDQNTVHEQYWSNKGWQSGILNKNAPKVSDYSALAATSSSTDIRLFYQRGDTIYEHSYTVLTGQWSCIEVCKALKGTSIAVTSCIGPRYHIFYQDPSLVLREYVFGKKFVWEAGDLLETDSLPYTRLATISWHRLSVHVRLYYVSKSGNLLELSKGSAWRKSAYSLSISTTMEEDVDLAAVQKNDGQQIRIYSLLPERKLRERVFSRTSGSPTIKNRFFGSS